MSGTWNWRGTNTKNGKTAVGDYNDIALNERQMILAFDSDMVIKKQVRDAVLAHAEFLKYKGAKVWFCHLPHPDEAGKLGLDDYLALGHTKHDLEALVQPHPPKLLDEDRRQTYERNNWQAKPERPKAEPISLEAAHTIFKRWLGIDYDLDALDVMLATAAVERLDGDPLWLLIISGSGNAKTETVQALDGIGATITSTISSPAALLSGTSRREQSADATGGLLRKLGAHGVMVIKDVTSLLSANRDQRAEVLAALREVYDGRWERNLGTDGGRTLSWRGRLAVIGAVTTAWDSAHDVVASMGDRFVLLRMDSSTRRMPAGRRAIGNISSEEVMRADLAKAVGGVLAGMRKGVSPPDEEEIEILLAAADLVTLARTGVIFDYRGDVIDAHAPEMPTRFA